MIHQLKTWPEYFEAIREGKKNFEVRKEDRNFQVGDILELREYNPETEKFTARSISKTIDYKLEGGSFGIEKGFCVLGLSEVKISFSKSEQELPAPNTVMWWLCRIADDEVRRKAVDAALEYNPYLGNVPHKSIEKAIGGGFNWSQGGGVIYWGDLCQSEIPLLPTPEWKEYLELRK